MLDDEIYKKRQSLDESIITGKSYEEIYKLSVELDELISKYYEREKKKDKKNSANN